MSDDRTLIEAAARAAGYHFQWEPALLNEWPEPTVFTPEGFGQYWNPLTDDGDALRLAVKLEIRIDWGAFDVVAIEYDHDAVARESKGDDPYAATRRAIVRAAATMAQTKETP